MAFTCPYCGHNVHSTPMYMTCEESSLCNQCGPSKSDAWLRSQEDELVARFSAYSITHQVEQQDPTHDGKPMTQRIHYASAAAHSFPVSPYNVNGNSDMSNATNETVWVAETDPKTYSRQSFLPGPVDSFDMHMDCELETSDAVTTTATTDSKRSSLDGGNDFQLSSIEGVRHNVARDVYDMEAEPYMSLGYEHGHKQNLTRGAPLPEEPSTGTPYARCKDPVYNARSWWEYGGRRHDYRWDCLRERAM